MIDFDIPPELEDVRRRVADFVRDEVLPVEADVTEETFHAVLDELRTKAREAGLWAPHLPPQWGGMGRIGHAMRWIGVSQRALDLAASRALEREAFGRRLAEHQAIQWMVADSAIELYASRLMVLHGAWKIDRGLDHRQEISMIKVFVAEALNRIVDRTLQIYGSLGISEDVPISRFYTDARAARIYDGPSEVHRMVIARELFKAQLKEGTTKGATGGLA